MVNFLTCRYELYLYHYYLKQYGDSQYRMIVEADKYITKLLFI